jgi:hypothetical protein
MESPYLSRFSKALLTGLFVGIIITLVCLAYNIYFRDTTRYPLASIINVSSLIFFVNLLFVVIGIIYYGFTAMFKKGDLVFCIVFIALTAFLAWRSDFAYRSDNPLFNHEFHQLLIAMVVIMGIGAALGIPVLYHSKKFEEHVL